MNINRIIKLSRRFGVPMTTTQHILRTARFIERFRSYFSDRVLFSDLLDDSEWCRLVPRNEGFRLLPKGMIPGMDKAVTRARQIFDERRTVEEGSNRKAHLRDLLRRGVWEDYAQLVDFALSEPMLKIAAGYLGALPELRTLSVFHTPANKSEKSSQLFHTDQDDVRQLKFLIYLTDVEPESGPLSFIPARHYRRLIKATRTNGRRLEDTEVFSVVPHAELVEVVGPAGSGVALDTNRSFHFGGRTRVGERGMMVIGYTTRYGLDAPENPQFEPNYYRHDPLRYAVLGG